MNNEDQKRADLEVKREAKLNDRIKKLPGSEQKDITKKLDKVFRASTYNSQSLSDIIKRNDVKENLVNKVIPVESPGTLNFSQVLANIEILYILQDGEAYEAFRQSIVNDFESSGYSVSAANGVIDETLRLATKLLKK